MHVHDSMPRGRFRSPEMFQRAALFSLARALAVVHGAEKSTIKRSTPNSARDVIYSRLIWELVHVDHVCSDSNDTERHRGCDFD